MRKRKPVLLNGEALMADGKVLEFDAVDQEELDGKIDAPQVAQVGEVLTVEAVDADGKPTKWKTAPAAAEQKQANWAQNDETAADYVKNRPFYEVDEAPLGEIVFTAKSASKITHTVNAMSMKVLDAIKSVVDSNAPQPRIRLFLCGKFYAVNVEFDRGAFRFFSDEILGHARYLNGEECYFAVQDNSVSFTVGESYSVSFFDINKKGYVKIPLGYFPDSIYTQESAPVRYGEGKLSTTQGYNTTASGYSSHAEGDNTTASGYYSHAEGIGTTASGNSSHAEGGNTTASGDTQHVQGKNNIPDETSAHIVGNGESPNERSNAHTIDWQGNAWFSGNVYVGSTSGTNKDKGSKKLVDISDLMAFGQEIGQEVSYEVSYYAIPKPTTAQVGQIVKVKAVDADGKITETEAVDIPSVSNDYELVFQETVAEDVGAYSRDTDKDGNPFSLTDVMVIIFTKPFAESTNSAGRGLGFLPTSRWGKDCVSCDIGSSISSANTNSVGRYNVVFVKVVNGYQVVTRAYESQNTTNVFGVLVRQTKAGNEMFGFHNDATKLMQIASPQGNITCVKIVGYTNPLVSAGTIVALYKKKGT